ncbi:MAG: hypothetical protein NXI12_07650 [Alphaproteobacteria bacterium]|nr:hypothetical protein [Alphaproteobacteria bacterium]
MPRWDWFLAGALMIVAFAWWISLLTRQPSEYERLDAAYEARCPEYEAAARAAFDGYGIDEVPPESIHTRKLDEWRLGNLHAVRCEILNEQASAALMEQSFQRTGASDDDIDRSRSGRNRKIFALRYYLWLRTGEGLEELEALARSMAREDVDSAVTLWMFRQGAAPSPRLDETGRIAPDDPGYRFVQLARPDPPENTPPDT